MSPYPNIFIMKKILKWGILSVTLSNNLLTVSPSLMSWGNRDVLYYRRRMDGHACMLRFLCEAASAPLHSDGLAGQLVNGLLLTPKYLIDAIIAQGDSALNVSCFFSDMRSIFGGTEGTFYLPK